MEDDTLLFCVLPNGQWEMLEKEHGKTKLDREKEKWRNRDKRLFARKKGNKS